MSFTSEAFLAWVFIVLLLLFGRIAQRFWFIQRSCDISAVRAVRANRLAVRPWQQRGDTLQQQPSPPIYESPRHIVRNSLKRGRERNGDHLIVVPQTQRHSGR